METNCAEGKINKDEDGSYEVTLDDDFLTALEYGMPPASGMVWSSFCYFSLSIYIFQQHDGIPTEMSTVVIYSFEMQYLITYQKEKEKKKCNI